MPLSVEGRRQLVEAVEDGQSMAEVARQFGVGRATVRRWVQRARGGESLEDRPRSGAPPLLTPDDLEMLRELVGEMPEPTTAAVLEAVAEKTGKSVSAPTLRRALDKLGLRKARPVVQTVEDEPPSDGDRYQPHHRREPAPGQYPSSLTDHEWELLEPEFAPDGPRGRGRPRKHGVRQLLDAIFYVMRTGCAWRYLPAEYPPWQTVYSAFRSWSDQGRFERMHHLLAKEWRAREGRNPEPTAGIIDSQTAKTTEKGGLEVGTGRSASTVGSGI